jgi:hypothetical protein
MDLIETESGPALFMSGLLGQVGGLAPRYHAWWTQAGWRLFEPQPSTVASGAILFDAGEGPRLHVHGGFQAIGDQPIKNIARWDGSRWEELGGGTSGIVQVATVAQLEGEPSLILGGSFQSVGEVPAARIARWNGRQWAPFGAGLNASPNAIVIASGMPFSKSGEQTLFAIGHFTASGELPLAHVASWNGGAWSPLGEGLSGAGSDAILADLGDGTRLYVTGSFTTAGGGEASFIAQWDGASWMPLGSGLPASGRTLALGDFGDGPRLFACTNADLGGAAHVLSWDGATWTSLAQVKGTAAELRFADLGHGPVLVLAGGFTSLNGQQISRLATFDGATWRPLSSEGSGVVPELHATSMIAREENEALVVYVAGHTQVDEQWHGRAQRIDGLDSGPVHQAVVSDLGEPLKGWAYDIMPDPDAPSAALLMLGVFIDADSASRRGIVRWSGAASSAWEEFPALLSGPPNRQLRTAAYFDDGSGLALYVGGLFDAIEGVAAKNVARRRDGVWEPVGAGIVGSVYDLHVHDDGQALALYAGFYPSQGAWGSPVNVACWNGVEWVAPGLDDAADSDAAEAAFTSSAITVLETHDDGDGPKLYAGRWWTEGHALWRLDGTVWTPIATQPHGRVSSLRSHDDGTGQSLYMGGDFTFYDTPLPAARGVVRWTGDAVSPVGWGMASVSGPNIEHLGVAAMVSLPARPASSDRQARGARLLVAGTFSRPLDTVTSGVAGTNFAIWGDGGVQVVSLEPSEVTAPKGGIATFSALATTKVPFPQELDPLVFQWRRDGVPLEDGPGAGATIAGATTPILTLLDVGQAAEGAYDAVIVGECGEVTTFAAALRVIVPCDGDVDGDGVVDGTDLGALLAAWGTDSPTADLDGDGEVGSADLALLISAWGCRG